MPTDQVLDPLITPGRRWTHAAAPVHDDRGHARRRLLAPPAAPASTAEHHLARLPMGMLCVSAAVLIAAARGSVALAGAVTATGLAATALVAPWTARLVDRYGQARVAVPATLLAV